MSEREEKKETATKERKEPTHEHILKMRIYKLVTIVETKRK